MRIPKVYGQSKITRCPFCQKQCIAENSQGVPVCSKHRDTQLLDLKCACGGWIDLLKGKWGPYGRCDSCGNMNFKRVLELNEDSIKVAKVQKKTRIEEPKEITITSRDNQYF